jgi:hypothetical protein
MNALSYHIFDGYKWLADDERSWTSNYHSAASFNNAKIAQNIGERQADGRAIYVLACLGWLP